MLVPTLLAVLAVLPAISAQSTSVSTSDSVSTALPRCSTAYGLHPVPAVPTWVSTASITNTFFISTTTHATVTVTPEATTFTDLETTTTTITTTTVSTPDATIRPTPSGFLPLIAVAPTGTSISRVKRAEIEGRAADADLDKRQAPAGSSNGFIAYPNGTTSGLYRRYPRRVDCTVQVITQRTITTTVTGDPETTTLPQSTATAVVTTTVSTTTTVTVVAPQPTSYAACAGNNVVNHIIDFNGRPLWFSRVVFPGEEGFPMTNEIISNVTTAVRCCEACQNTPFCAGSFFAPAVSECHLRLTQPYTPYPPTLPSGSPTGTTIPVPTSTGTPDNGTCANGSLSLYLGVIRGAEEFPPQYAVSFSNGPCGRFAWSGIPLPGRGA